MIPSAEHVVARSTAYGARGTARPVRPLSPYHLLLFLQILQELHLWRQHESGFTF